MNVNDQELRDVVLAEASAFVEAALNRRLESSLAALRGEIEDAARLYEAALQSPLAALPSGSSLTSLVERLTRSWSEAVDEATERARNEAESDIGRATQALENERQENTRVTASLEAARVEVEVLKRQLDAETAGGAALRRELERTRRARARAEAACEAAEAMGSQVKAACEREIERLRDELEAGDCSTGVSAARPEADAERQRLATALTTATRGLAIARAQHDAIEAELGAGIERVRALEKSNAELVEAQRALQAQLDAADLVQVALRRQLAIAAAAAGQPIALAAPVLGPAPAAEATPPDPETLASALHDATNTAEALIALADEVRSAFPRVAVFNHKGNALHGVYQAGFDLRRDISKIVVPLSVESVLSQAVTSGATISLTTAETTDATHLPLGAAVANVCAMPIEVGGRTIAVIYGDDADQPVDPARHADRVKMAEAWRAGALGRLQRLDADPELLTELDGYAARLLDEVESMYTLDVGLGLHPAALVDRLTANLRYAQDACARRFQSAGIPEADIFDERLTALLDLKATTPFGRHLAIASYAKGGGDRASEGDLAADVS